MGEAAAAAVRGFQRSGPSTQSALAAASTAAVLQHLAVRFRSPKFQAPQQDAAALLFGGGEQYGGGEGPAVAPSAPPFYQSFFGQQEGAPLAPQPLGLFNTANMGGGATLTQPRRRRVGTRRHFGGGEAGAVGRGEDEQGEGVAVGQSSWLHN